MALRLIEMVLQEKDGAEVRELFKEHKVLDQARRLIIEVRPHGGSQNLGHETSERIK
jgi:hypothetical protein